jgi:hypothetical protein
MSLCHPTQANEVLEVFGNELRPVVRDDSGCHAGVRFANWLENDFDIDLLCFFTNVPMDDTAAEFIQDRGHEAERPGDDFVPLLQLRFQHFDLRLPDIRRSPFWNR